MRHLLLALLTLTALLQTAGAATPPAALFDFWVGDWTVTWTNANGSAGRGRNRVHKILEGKVIEEDFATEAAAPPRLLGRSLSVLDKAGVWRQAWADNQGGFFALTGGSDGETRFFTTDFKAVGGQLQGQRMRFHGIQPDGFTWDWEASSDGGKTWTLQWRVRYTRNAGRP